MTTRSMRVKLLGETAATPGLVSASSWLTRSTALKKRAFRPPDAAPRDADSDVALAGAGPTDRDHVALLRQEVAAGQIAHQLLVDRRILEDEVGELLGERQLGDPHLVADRACLLLGDLGLEQGSNDLVDAVLALDAGGDDLVIGRPHAGELQGRHHLQDLRAIHR